MLPRLLLDTHVLLRWLIDSRKLSRTQLRALESAVRRGEPLAFSAISLLEIAVLASGENPALKLSVEDFFEDLNSNPVFRVLPLRLRLPSRSRPSACCETRRTAPLRPQRGSTGSGWLRQTSGLSNRSLSKWLNS